MAGRQSTPVLESVQRLFTAGTMTGAGKRQLLDRFLTQRRRGSLRGDRASPRADGARGLSPRPRRPQRRGGRLPGHLPRPGPQGRIDPRSVRPRHMAPRRRQARRRAGTCQRQATPGTRASGGRNGHLADERPASEGQAELRAVIDQEVSRLPERYRSPLVLCDLEGCTQEQAAAALDAPWARSRAGCRGPGTGSARG